ncbi:MAG TPA: response regulator transcription factor [Hyphomicrobiaceae bacterium]|nr:response regulator transcription factor [Hyphomicrobiaceae bacterium]
MTDKIRVAIVDIYPIFREGVAQALRRDKRCLVVGEGTTVEDAERVAGGQLDVLLIEAAVRDSLRAVRSILATRKRVKIVFLASVEDEVHATQALRDGAQGYLMKGVSAAELIRAIVAVHNGKRSITSELACRLITRSEPPRSSEQLSLRERQVMDHTSRGLTNKEIASLLGLTVSTIKHYKSLAFRKLGVRNRLEATIFADGQISKAKS